MRTIKFRAYDKVQKQFVYFELGVTDGKMLTTPLIYANHILSPWQQFTGLFDKNGKEIYEGDILRFDRYSGKGTKPKVRYHYWEVFFSEGGQWAMRKEGQPTRLSGNEKRHEVFGNIYSNPDLLKPNV